MALVAKIDSLLNNCDCDPKTDNNCPNCREMQALGRQIEELKNRDGESVLRIGDTITMTVPQYAHYRNELSMTDGEVGEKIGFKPHHIQYWKSINRKELETYKIKSLRGKRR